METPPRSRLLPPDPAAVRAARPTRPRARALPILGAALIAAIVLSIPAERGAGAPAAGSEVTGSIELRAAAAMRRTPGREAETVVVAQWSSAATGATDAVDARQDAARAALAAWLAERRAVELVDAAGPARAALRDAVADALFPDGDGRVDEVIVRAIRLR